MIHGCNLQDNWKAIIIDARLKPSNISYNKININQFTHKSQHKHIHLKKKKLRNTMNAHCSMNRNNWIKDPSQD